MVSLTVTSTVAMTMNG